MIGALALPTEGARTAAAALGTWGDHLLALSVQLDRGVAVAAVGFIDLHGETARRLWMTAAVVGVIVAVRLAVGFCIALLARHQSHNRAVFWTRQGASLASLIVFAVAALAIWVDDPARLTTVAGLTAAGIAIAAQKVVTAFAGYLVIMRGKTFTVGDRIKIGGVRGDVVSLGFLQTRILEMGQPNEVNEQETPGMWVRARQFTGRIVSVTNDKVFDEPVYNFTREFPFVWEEMHVPIPYRADRARAEAILLAAVHAAVRTHREKALAARDALGARFGLALETTEPRVYWRLTDNWLEMTVRFAVPDHGSRDIKDQITRTVLQEFDAARIGIGSTTLEVTMTRPS